MSERNANEKRPENGFVPTVLALGLSALAVAGVVKYAPGFLKQAATDPSKIAFHLPHFGSGATGPKYTGRDPHQITVNTRIDRVTAERLFGVVLQAGGTDNAPATNAEVAGIQKVAFIIGRNSFGWNSTQDGCLKDLWTRESNWNSRAYNPASATGIPQDLMSVNGAQTLEYFPNFRDNPVEQVQWGEEYIDSRYKTPCNANYEWFQQTAPDGTHWYRYVQPSGPSQLPAGPATQLVSFPVGPRREGSLGEIA